MAGRLPFFRLIAGLFAASLAACSPERAAVPKADRLDGSRGAIVLKADGLDVAGTGLEIGFGRAETGAVEAVRKLVGRPPTSRQHLRECAAGPIDAAHWDGGITLYFLDGDFVGWATGSERFASAEGLSVGDTPLELGAISGLTRRQTVRGPAVTLGGITGDLDAQGQVRRLRAGRTCDGV